MDELVPASPAERVSDKHAPSSADAFDSENREESQRITQKSSLFS